MQKNNIKKKKLFVISGSSGVGKGTIIKGFLSRHPDFNLTISFTTRKKREGEVDGVNYFFISMAEFKRRIKNDEFLEWAEFSDNYYGTGKEFVQNSLNKGENLILEVDTQGALQIKKALMNSVLIFIEPPSYQDLEMRLRNRKTESEESIAKRLDFVRLEMENSVFFDYKIVNDKLEYTILALEKIIKIERV